MNEMKSSNPDKLGLTDEPVTDSYLQQLRALEVEAVDQPIMSTVLQLTGAKLLRLSNKLDSLIAAEWDKAPPAEAFQRMQPAIESFLKLTRQADRYLRFSQQSVHQGKYPGQPR